MPRPTLHAIGRALMLASDASSRDLLARLGSWLAFWQGVNPLQIIRLRLLLRTLALEGPETEALIVRLGNADGQPWETLLAAALAVRDQA
jgi:hypothetical protein